MKAKIKSFLLKMRCMFRVWRGYNGSRIAKNGEYSFYIRDKSIYIILSNENYRSTIRDCAAKGKLSLETSRELIKEYERIYFPEFNE